MASLPHLIPGRDHEFKHHFIPPQNAARPIKSPNELPFLQKSLEQRRSKPKPPTIKIKWSGEYRCENPETNSSRNDPSRWIWGDLSRHRRDKHFYYNKSVMKEADRDGWKQDPITSEDNRAGNVLQRWRSMNDLVKPTRRFCRRSTVDRRPASDPDMFILLRHASWQPSQRPLGSQNALPTPRSHIW
jgi:hypothetical protein